MMNVEQGLARKHLAGKLWTIQDLEIAAEVESGQAKELVLEWEQQEIVHQAQGGYYFVDAPPPALPQQHRWSHRDTAMAAAGMLALLVLLLTGGMVLFPSAGETPASAASTPEPVPTATAVPLPTATPTPDGWKRLDGSVVAYYAPDGDVAFALDAGARYQPLARAHGTAWVQVKTDQGEFWVRAAELRGLELHEAEALADLTAPTPVPPTPTERVVIERVIVQEPPVIQQPVSAAPTMPPPVPEPTALPILRAAEVEAAQPAPTPFYHAPAPSEYTKDGDWPAGLSIMACGHGACHPSCLQDSPCEQYRSCIPEHDIPPGVSGPCTWALTGLVPEGLTIIGTPVVPE